MYSSKRCEELLARAVDKEPIESSQLRETGVLAGVVCWVNFYFTLLLSAKEHLFNTTRFFIIANDKMEAEEGSAATVDAISHDQTEQSTKDADTTEPAAPVAENPPAPVKRNRGRHAKDPLGKSICFKCQRVEEMEIKLREYLDNPTGDAAHTTLEFSFPVTAAFMVPKREPIGTQAQNPHKRTPYVYSTFSKTAVSVIDALHTIKDADERALTQRAISKALVESVERTDGYKYSFHNHWLSREDQASRFSYYCNDSSLNKGRAANEGAAKLRNDVKIRKSVFECQGLLSVKFSITKMSLELHYKHVPLHPTYEERAPIPRKESKRRKLLEIFNPELLSVMTSRKRGKTKVDPKPKEPKEPKERPNKKRPATEPVPEVSAATVPEPNDGNDSLQPLFDFLGSAGRIELQSSENAVSDQVDAQPGTQSTPAPENDAAANGEGTAGNASKQGKPKRTPYPGMMAGFMSGESITWGSGQNARVPRPSKRSKRMSAPAHSAGPPPSSSTTEHTAAISPPTTVPASNPELEALRAQLLAAEQKIRDLEAEKTRSNPPMGWNPPPRPDYSQQYYPPPHAPTHNYPYPPPQWHYPPPPGPMPPGGPPVHQHSGSSIPANQPAPTYGFVGGRPTAPSSQPANNAKTNPVWPLSNQVTTASVPVPRLLAGVEAASQESGASS
ncbi:hypothetical protein LTR84_013159 [Exophiala bonariae]|uniref:Uncharacterized protein n=1 Tax=Exophiala bonariae TaxID=1690606 RepID=A0AAV9NDZ9_9EURO|nr:hypothetical protein LTR84_013159 [Exophiala bonariae]